MSKVLLLGMCPLPLEKTRVLNAPGLRTWQFTQALMKDGHKICLVCSRANGAYNEKQLKNITQTNLGKNVSYYSAIQKKFLDPGFLQKIHNKFKPDCIVSASSFLPSYMATQIKTSAPVWIDQAGELLAEGQMRAFVENNNDYLYEFWKVDREVLEKGDAFSVISNYQRYSLIGKLGAKGRLNKETVGYEFVHVVPTGINRNGPVKKINKKILRGKYVKKDDFVVLWSGGYNTWTDVDTLFHALEKAMMKNPRVKFVSTGGSISTHNELTYPRFIKLIEKSKFRDRFIMLGWVPTEDLPGIYKESNIGINIDNPCYEAQLGDRNRIVHWMEAGLPVLTTNFSELTQILAEKKLGFIFPSNDKNILSELILKLSSKKELLAEYARAAKSFAEKEFTCEKTTEPLRRWVKSPKSSPDKKPGTKLQNMKTYGKSIESDYIDSLKWKINALEDHLKYLKDQSSQVARLNAIIKGNSDEILLRDKKIIDAFRDASRKTEELRRLQLKHASLSNHTANLNQHIKNLEAERKTLIAATKTMDSKISNLNARLAKTSEEVSCRDKKLHLLELKYVDLNNHSANLAQHAKNLEAERNGLKGHAQGLTNEIERINKELGSCFKEISDKGERIHKLELEIKGLNNLNKELDNVSRQLEKVEQQKTALESESRELSKQIEVLSGYTDVIKSEKEKLLQEKETQIAGLNAQYDALYTEYSAMKAECEALRTKLGLIYDTRAYKFYRIITKFKKRPKEDWLCGFYK
ncbi:MAG: glycosyltransferase [Candidatus Omnitrophota bacterium]|jgi:glycosyltransferase involved in cell wall biosynthesis/predicted  nucleic acid-binding Zn-ribbon protein